MYITLIEDHSLSMSLTQSRWRQVSENLARRHVYQGYKPQFQRTWIIQEGVLATGILIMSGKETNHIMEVNETLVLRYGP